MSRGPGRVQRVLLDAIAEPQATAERPPDEYGTPGPRGVTVTEIYQRLGWSGTERTQRHSLQRAIRVLRANGQLMTYSRRACGTRIVGWEQPCRFCGSRWGHSYTLAVGRVRTEVEAEDARRAGQKASAMLARL